MTLKVKYFGTGAALNPRVDTTHFVISAGEKKLYVDAGNGMNLAQKVLRGEIEMPEYIFMTHCHTDHLLGLPHLIRIIGNRQMTIIISEELAEKVRSVMHIVGKGKLYEKKVESGNIQLITIKEGEDIEIYNWKLSPINLYSEKTEQFGFQLYAEGEHIVFFGDEAVGVMKRSDLNEFTGCDRLLCEAFCTDVYKEIRDPHPKAHITAGETGDIASKLKAKNLIISHVSEEVDIERNIQLEEVKSDASTFFSGDIYTPHDGDTIILEN